MRKITASLMLGLMLSSLAGGQVPNQPAGPTNNTNEQVITSGVSCIGFLWFAFAGNLLRLTSSY